MQSSKWHALGNAYVVVDRQGGEALTADGAVELSRNSDGVLEVLSADEDSLELVVWNPDGSQAELSGNGTRIAAAWLAERSGATTISVHVGPRKIVARVLGGGRIEQDLGEVFVGAPERIAGIELVPVTVGNPHAVVEGNPADVIVLGPLLETHERFSERTNVQVAHVDRPGEVTARVWERGVGETSSSGTGAVAVAAATHGEGEVLVHFPGGDLHVRLERGRAYLVGPAERLA